MNADSRMIVGCFNHGSAYVTTAGDRKKLFPLSEGIGQVDIEEWNDTSLKANFAAELIFVIMFVSSALLGSALSEAGKDLYSLTKRGVVRLLNLKIKETYKSTSTVVYIRLVDDTPVAITLQLFQNIRGEEAPTEEEIEERLDVQFDALDREWPMVESKVRLLRINHKKISATVFNNGQVSVGTEWAIPGWQPSAEAPGRVERSDLQEMLNEWTFSEEDTTSIKEMRNRFDDMGF